jgi:hypothetical protein
VESIVNLYLDIETIPAQRPDVLDEIRASEHAALEAALAAVKPPSNYGADAAAKWMNEKGNAQRAALVDAFEATVDEAYRKTGLDGAYGQVCVLGWAFDSEKPAFLSGLEEAALLRNFAAVLRDDLAPSDLHSTTVIGHNVASFDLRFLAQRSIIHGIRPHLVIARAAQAKPWETEKVFDTMVQWAGVGWPREAGQAVQGAGHPVQGRPGRLEGVGLREGRPAGRSRRVLRGGRRARARAASPHDVPDRRRVGVRGRAGMTPTPQTSPACVRQWSRTCRPCNSRRRLEHRWRPPTA